MEKKDENRINRRRHHQLCTFHDSKGRISAELEFGKKILDELVNTNAWLSIKMFRSPKALLL
jgi:hypothetical protein